MPVLPHDVTDLRLAPLVLMLDARVEELGRLAPDELQLHVGLVSDRPDWSREVREEGLLEAVRHTIELHDWELSWDVRGVAVTHGSHRVVLGVPATLTDYLDGTQRASQLV